jgi:DNA-binding MarR family transcriptional regulator
MVVVVMAAPRGRPPGQHHSTEDDSEEWIWQDYPVADLRELFDDLVRVEIGLWEAVDRRLRDDLGLPLGRFEALQAIARTPTARVQDVADAIMITVGAASKLVDRLEGGGLCERRPHPTDRRSSAIALTAAGRRTLDDAAALVDDELAHRLDGLGPDEVSALAALLATTRARLGDARPRGGRDARAGG